MVRHRQARVLGAALALGLLGSGALVWRGTAALWAGSTSSPANVWTGATVGLDDNDAGTASVLVSGLRPGDVTTRCLQVTYTGTAPSVPVRLYAFDRVDAKSLAASIHLTVESGTYTPDPADPMNCDAGTFTDPTTLYSAAAPVASNGKLATFLTTYTNYATGLPAWTATTGAPAHGFRFTYRLDAQATSTLRDARVEFSYRWESQAGS